jgi:ribosomal protein S18 acetylase RimI-like enzyme
MPLEIRPATFAHSEALSRICLLTANYGTSAEGLHSIKELPGLVYALPYVNLPTTFGFVLEDVQQDGTEGEVFGYILGTTDTKLFMEAAEKDWYPSVRENYPKEVSKEEEAKRTEADKQYIKIIHKPDIPSPEVFEVSPVHIHIDLLPQVQRQGWGRKLMGAVVEYLREHHPGIDAIWIGVDPRNEEGKKFYRKIGGKELPTSDGEYFSLLLEDFDKAAAR